MAKEKRFTVFNATDGFFASPDTFTSEEADQFIRDFPKRYEHQGYYLTSSGERIDPKDVILEKYPAEESIFTDNPVELATKLAHQRLLADYGSEAACTVEDDDETSYTEEAQKLFDELYDEYYEIITGSGI